MRVKQCHKSSPSHHHFYRWYGSHSQSWVVYGIVLTIINHGHSHEITMKSLFFLAKSPFVLVKSPWNHTSIPFIPVSPLSARWISQKIPVRMCRKTLCINQQSASPSEVGETGETDHATFLGVIAPYDGEMMGKWWLNGGLMGFVMVISWRFNQQKPGMLVDIPSGYD